MKTKLIQKVGQALKKATPTVLTCVGAVGVITTAALAVKATPRAFDLVKADSEENHDGDPYAFTKTEAIKSCWKCYIPAVVVGTATITCIFGANILNRRQQASLASAYALVSRSYNDYKRTVKEMCGQEVHEQILQHMPMPVEKADPPRIVAQTLISDPCLDFEDANEEERLFYDRFSQRYFSSTLSRVLQAEYHINRNFALMGGCVDLNTFYEYLGIEKVPELAEFGWWVSDELYWVDFDHVKTMVDDGLNGEIECYIIDMVFTPTDVPPD